MKYKTVENGYIITIGTGNGQISITEEEYKKIVNVLNNKPEHKEGFGLRLRDSDLTWEEYQLPPTPEPEPEAEELLDILLGGDAE